MRLSTRMARGPLVAAPCLAALALVACSKKEPPPKPPPPQVSYIVVQPRDVKLTTDLPGRTNAYRTADVRPQVNGIILKRMFVEGSIVKAGQQLYQIDPAPYKASLDSALASQAKAEASATSAKLLAERYKPLAEARAVSRQDYDNAIASAKQAEADVASAKASVESARINLVYTRLLSPITGRTGRSSVTEGALVTSGQANALVTIQQLDPIYVDVTQSSTLLLKLRKELTTGRLTQKGEDAALVTLTLEDGTNYSFPGKLKFSEVTVDQGTGSITLRGEFPNPTGLLLPGMFVHEQVQEGIRDHALMVPQQGVTRDPKGEPTAMVVGPDGKVEARKLIVDRAIGDEWLVNQGLIYGDKLIVMGLQGAKPGAPVTATETTKAELNKPAAAASAASGGASGAAGGGPEAGKDKDDKKKDDPQQPQGK